MNNHAITKEAFGSLFEPQVSEALSSFVARNAVRLDAGAYSAGSLAMQNFINVNDRPTIELSKIANIFGFGPFKRTYIEDSKKGIPLLTSAEIMELDPDPKVMAKVDNPNWPQYQIKQRSILVSCSGTIGNIALVPKKWDSWGVSQDAIRVIPQGGCLGFIYSFLRLPWMKDAIVGKKSGSVIDHIYEDDLKRLVVPLPSEACIQELESKINQVLNLREESDELLAQANTMIHEVNGLSELQRDKVDQYDPEGAIEAIIVSSTEVFHNNHAGSEYRLDAHYYNPLAELAIKNIRQCKSEVKTIDDVTKMVFMCGRFKRNYVDKEYGVPFLSGKNIIQIRPSDLKYISLTETSDINDLKLEATWTLITRSGTIGRTCFVWKNYENYAATEHIIRIVPNEEEIDPGCLYAFLSSSYGKQQVLRFRHGSVIDEVTAKQIKKVIIPLPSESEQKEIGDLVRAAYEKLAEAIRLEDEAQKILMDALTNNSAATADI
ncbi:MAG TPA: restriction endonuclease subunit S [Alphaproteobacteria bacterium]|nr:restriction endonuclease subunit S [Alphaproteobacteria bacterium]